MMTVCQQLSPPEDEQDSKKKSPASEFDEDVWTTRMMRATCDAFLQTISEIETLSGEGCTQLACDINYFVNVCSALVEEEDAPVCFESLEFLLKCETSDQTYKEFEFDNGLEENAC